MKGLNGRAEQHGTPHKDVLVIRADKLLFSWTIVLCLMIGYARASSGAHPLQRSSIQSRVEQLPIRLVLQTSRRTYRAGERIEVSIYLENMSQDAQFYVGRDIGRLSIRSLLHYLDLSIINERGREIPIPRAAVDHADESPRLTTSEKLARDYVWLGPRTIYGIQTELFEPLRPGQYRLTATYREEEALRWTEAERAALPVPVWTQPLVSDTVMITILPRISRRMRR